ncbi:hypothetical protein CUMW_256590 [Citrus unshiu]|uniref:Leucine-rich repeat-containing N-terminal plant-type domain-containing protein n=1 Tax=Citrus unshiu TaxID=55188 RepID=A0A2H5QS60_CITUN|nr:hypothetical protein CUMW_256590 [Citrus unshiu]
MWASILAGEIPTEMGNLQNLEYLALNSNNLTAENHFTGHLPSTIGHSLPNMDWLSLAKNKLSGTIPNSITNAFKLGVLDLSYNSFSGLIPSTFGNLRFLGLLNLVYNYLTTESSTGGGDAGIFSLRGSTPQEIGNFRGLILLSLSNNDLDGTIPASMQTLKTLQVSYFNANHFDLCRLERLTGLFLNENKLFGHIPQCLGSLTSLRTLFLSSNTLTSSIPSSLWSLEYILYTKLKGLNRVDLSRNQLSRDIPISTGGLKDIATLSLARNKFYGLIPKSFGSLIRLESLDLPSNNLSGEIPKSMEALSYLKQLNNYALCGPLGLQVLPCKEDNSKGSKSATLLVLKYTLPSIISNVLITTLERAFRSFDSECVNVRHQDLIKITSSCCNPGSKALVPEFMLNGSLEK